MAGTMYRQIADTLRKTARILVADYSDTQQYVYTNPGQNQVSDISYDLLHGAPGQRQSDPTSRKEDEKKKHTTLRLEEPQDIGPVLNTALDPLASSEIDIPESPKTDEQGEVKNITKARGDQQQEELNRDTYRSVGPHSGQEHV